MKKNISIISLMVLLALPANLHAGNTFFFGNFLSNLGTFLKYQLFSKEYSRNDLKAVMANTDAETELEGTALMPLNASFDEHKHEQIEIFLKGAGAHLHNGLAAKLFSGKLIEISNTEKAFLISKLGELCENFYWVTHLDLSYVDKKQFLENRLAIRKLRRLVYLNLSGNDMQIFPEAFYVLDRLEVLDLTENNIDTLEVFEKMEGLRELILHKNYMSDADYYIGKMHVVSSSNDWHLCYLNAVAECKKYEGLDY